MASDTKVLGILLIVLGALILLDIIGIPFLETILGVAAVVVGIMMLMGKMAGPRWLAITLLVVGAIVLATPYLSFLTGALANVIHVVLGVVLIVLGVMKIR